MKENERLAIIKGVRYGMRDAPWEGPSLTFSTYLDESTTAMQCFPMDKAAQVIIDAQVDDVHKLNNMPCVVQVSEDGMLIKFVRVVRIS